MVEPALQMLDRMILSVGGVPRDFYFRRNSSDSRVITQIFHEDCYDLERLRRFTQIIEFLARHSVGGKRPLIVDAGANIGASSVYFAARFPGASVVALEPDFGNYQLLAENSKNLRVKPVHCALAATQRRQRVIDPGEGFWGYRTEFLDDGVKAGVRSITMNQIYQIYAAEHFPFIVKIDIEGGEKDLFSKDVDWVRRTPLLIVELHDWLLPFESNSSSFLQCISQLERDFVYIGENVYSIANDLGHDLPWTDQTTVSGGVSAQGEPVSMPALEEPLEEQLVAAMNEFQTEIRILRHTDNELRAARDALTVEKAQLQEALTIERSAVQAAQQSLASTSAERIAAQEALRDTQLELASVRQEFVATQSSLRAVQQQLSSAQERLAGGLQEVTVLQAREKSLVSELSAAMSSLQQLRDQLHERDRCLAVARRKSEGMEAKLAARQKRDVSAKEAHQRLKNKLRARTRELAALREQKLVGLAIKVGARLNRRTIGRLSQKLGWPRR